MVFESENDPSLHSNVDPAGGAEAVVLAGLFAAIFAAGVAGLLAALFDAIFAAVFDTVFDIVFAAVLDIALVFIFEAVFILVFLTAFELFEFVAAPPQAKVRAINDKSVVESNNLFFIY